MSSDCVATVQRIYAAFGRDDVSAILGEVTEDTEWGFAGAQGDVPWHATVRGKGELPAFFRTMAENMEYHAFEPLAFMPSGNEVLVHLRLAYTVRKTGRKVDEEQIQWWSCDGAGRVWRLRHFEDTAQVSAACHGLTR